MLLDAAFSESIVWQCNTDDPGIWTGPAFGFIGQASELLSMSRGTSGDIWVA